MRFLFDEMLESLAGWCRVFGMDSFFFKGKSDSELLDYAKENGLVLVTRDEQLAGRCKKSGVESLLIDIDGREEQIAQVVKAGGKLTFPDRSRCSECNSILETAEKEEMEGKVPEKVFEKSPRFWRCPGCGKAYWEGGHWKNIIRVRSRVMEILDNM